jgi:hypothetical protein
MFEAVLLSQILTYPSWLIADPVIERDWVRSLVGYISSIFSFLFAVYFFFGSWALGPESLFPPAVACCLHPVLLIFIFYYLFVLFYLMLFNFIYLHIISISCFMFNNIKNMSCHLFCLLFLQY